MENKIITDYMILEFSSSSSLNDCVNTNIQIGWQPYGVLFQLENSNLCQAMVIYKDEITITSSEQLNTDIDNLLNSMP